MPVEPHGPFRNPEAPAATKTSTSNAIQRLRPSIPRLGYHGKKPLVAAARGALVQALPRLARQRPGRIHPPPGQCRAATISAAFRYNSSGRLRDHATVPVWSGSHRRIRLWLRDTPHPTPAVFRFPSSGSTILSLLLGFSHFAEQFDPRAIATAR